MSQAESTLLPGWTSRRIIAATLVVIAVIFSFWLLYHFRLVIFSLFVGIVIGTALKPVVNWLNRRGLSAMPGAVLVYVVLLALVIAFALLVVPLIVEQITTIFEMLPDYYQSLRALLLSSRSMLLWRLGLQLPPELPGMTGVPQPETAAAAEAETGLALAAVGQVLGYLGLVGWTIFVIIGTFLLGFYWTLEGPRVIRTMLLMIPQAARESTQNIIEGMEAKVGAYIRGQTILCVTIGLLSFIAYFLIGLPYALVLALIAGVLEAVPYLGPTLGAIPALLLALTADPSKAIWVLVATIIIQQIENNVLVPKIMDQSVGVNPIVTLLSIAAFGTLWGVPGAVLAIPIAAIIQLLLDRFVLGPDALDSDAVQGRGAISVLRYETQDFIQDIRKYIRDKDKDLIADEPVDKLEEDIEAIASTLDSVLAEASQEEPQREDRA